ncbi:DUF4426 domain-containing protein [Rheinheimera sp. MMS21-TC3]|uniref:DUF4426 domain-containing protein n=1 Tax=Rheinheimera sp. MMS21-TC3 TaxID=3072790 RepID=UPI0028C47EE4|nr:DUF4426 domain-containing protein [Rheinheimera sp. MMS21-TC3]WNO61388.1 DUF4426 domain-containing protein [Rheinheimera sp. MMS21-TC3]
MKLLLAAFLTLLLATSSQLSAEQMQQLGLWDVHYIAFPAPLLTPEIAQQYRIQRSKYNAVINISVLNSQSQQAQKVSISGIAKDLLGRQIALDFTEVVEGKAIYYLAQLPFKDQQVFDFTLTLSQKESLQQLKFKQKLYVD